MKKILFVSYSLIIIIVCVFSQSPDDSNKSFWDYWNDFSKADNLSSKELALRGAISNWKTSDGENNLSLTYNNIEFMYCMEGLKYHDLYNSDKNITHFQLARDYYIQSIEIRGSYSAGYENIYQLFTKAGYMNEAIEFFSQVISKYPNSSIALEYRADSYLNSSRFTEASKDYQNAITLLTTLLAKRNTIEQKDISIIQSKIMEIKGKIAQVLLGTREFEKALLMTDEALRSNPETDNFNVLFPRFKSASILSMISFGNGEYDKALSYLNIARETNEKNDFIKNNFKFTEGWDFHTGIIKERKNIGTIKPLIRHKMMVIYYNNLKAPAADGSNTLITNSINETMKSDTRIHYRALNRYIETFSNGRITLEFSETNIDEPIQHIQNSYADFTPVNRMMPWKFWDAIIRDYDSVILCWNGQTISNTFFGGGFLSPYNFDDSRGVISIPSNWLVNEWNPGLIIHEFFHIVEFCCGITPTHGAFTEFRSSFPGWKGIGEFDYYKWHFKNTISDSVLTNLDLKNKYPVNKTYTELPSIPR